MLHNHRGCSPRWLCNILKVSINSVESGICTITDLEYGWLAFFWKNFHFYQYNLRQFVSVNNIEPGFRAITDLKYTMASESPFRIEVAMLSRNFCAMHGLTSFFSQWNVVYITAGLLISLVTLLEYLSCFKNLINTKTSKHIYCHIMRTIV